jgi:hypothetical protein
MLDSTAPPATAKSSVLLLDITVLSVFRRRFHAQLEAGVLLARSLLTHALQTPPPTLARPSAARLGRI